MDHLKEAREALRKAARMLEDVDIIEDLRGIKERCIAIETAAEAGCAGKVNDKTAMLIACRDVAMAAADDVRDDMYFLVQIFSHMKKACKCLEDNKARNPAEEELRDLFREEQDQNQEKSLHRGE